MDKINEMYDNFIEYENQIYSGENRFIVDDFKKADWCLKKIKNFKKQKENIEEYVKEEIKKLQDFLEKESKKIDLDIEHFELLLKEYVDGETEKDSSFKLKTITGSVSYGKVIKKIKYNENKILDYLIKNNYKEYIKTEVINKIDKNKFKKSLTILEDGKVINEFGEVVDNIEVEEYRNFNISFRE